MGVDPAFALGGGWHGWSGLRRRRRGPEPPEREDEPRATVRADRARRSPAAFAIWWPRMTEREVLALAFRASLRSRKDTGAFCGERSPGA